jgi:3,4-dihydroxy 2-butanone 4-phosphate synthase/GTP cyclohydrolase II
MADEALEIAGPADLPTPLGEFEVYAFRHEDLDGDHVALVAGDPSSTEPPGTLCRVHSACLTGDAFHSQRCDCGAQFEKALDRIEDEGEGVLVYLNQEGRGIGLFDKIRAYRLQDEGRDTVEANEELGLPADARSYGAAADLLAALGVEHVRLMTNNPDKVTALEDGGVRVEERVPLLVEGDEHSASYLGTKRDRLGHLLPP